MAASRVSGGLKLILIDRCLFALDLLCLLFSFLSTIIKLAHDLLNHLQHLLSQVSKGKGRITHCVFDVVESL